MFLNQKMADGGVFWSHRRVEPWVQEHVLVKSWANDFCRDS